MEDDPLVARYFGYLNLFTSAMLILVLGDSLPVTFVGWEGVGLCSYLLIGFWFTKEQNAYAGRKAFIVNRIGDFGFLLAMFLIFSAASTLSYDGLSSSASADALRAFFLGHARYATVASLLLILGAAGKSAQLPLYVWLPDAMAGPTPVSALIHAATMVTAGVYLVARMHFLFEMDPFVLGVLSCIGAATALFAATIGVAQRPIKKILAYSTVSQLGFMFIGVGTRAYGAGIYHLVTHALFKAGLFLGAGSVMHALSGEEDVFKMGGLRKKLPITHVTFLVYCLAIAGIFPFSGFFSKDAILASAFSFDYPEVANWPHWLGHVVYGVSLVAAALTAFYMFRAYFLMFRGEWRGDEKTWAHAHESPPAMTVPLVLLAIGAAAAGLIGIPESFHADWNLFEEWLIRDFPPLKEAPAAVEWGLMAVATVVSLGGIALAWRMYGRGPKTVEAPGGRFCRVVANKYYVDEIYDFAFVRPAKGIAYLLWKVVDALVIDLIAVRGVAFVVDMVGRTVRLFQSGDVQRYLVGVIVGTALIIGVSAKWASCNAAPFDVNFEGREAIVHARGMPRSPGLRPLEYTFDFDDGSQPVVQAQPVARHMYEQAGARKIKVTVRDPRWETHATEARQVVVP
jgi:NADH-quinone oxidoreductase subunit L